ncbi:hypothetical protein M885DRAFT_513383 [Pelagophyceae sp. CCMP2097]|nr:hypothetical protein M885DRAFT_513383 [Pelagophyceae sp. CCMP2097]|mmetsp:Transcript_31618/g.106486  ORF Transcript_31618/g.106486 Transcript_31618/m.106486 type:complete len:88 (-) Transcript_31618:209-472(-)
MSFMMARTVSRAIAPLAARPAVSRPAVRRMGGHHGVDENGHNQHMCFDGKVFDKGLIGGMLGFILIGGSGIIVFAVWFQNKKHGFIK